MDPDLVRLLLIVLGVLLVAGIYLWDRYQRSAPIARPRRGARRTGRRADAGHRPAWRDPDDLDPPAGPEPRDAAVDAFEAPRPAAVDRREPVFADPPDPPAEPAAPAPAARARPPHRAADADATAWVRAERDADAEQLSMGLAFDAHGDGDYLSTDPALADAVERKLIVIHLVARDAPLKGRAVAEACRAAGLVYGDMSIFHRRAGGGGPVLFSLASMVEPGVFPAEPSDAFTTPGLTLFTQLPGARDGIEIYDEMLATARRLAGLLPVDIKDERRNKLTRQMQEHMRESIIEHRRRVRLARSRH